MEIKITKLRDGRFEAQYLGDDRSSNVCSYGMTALEAKIRLEVFLYKILERKIEMRPLMECGHLANGEDSKGRPVCVICVGINSGARELDKNQPSLEGRMARCSCGREVKSDFGLAFFGFKPNSKTDIYYCGHGGWD